MLEFLAAPLDVGSMQLGGDHACCDSLNASSHEPTGSYDAVWWRSEEKFVDFVIGGAGGGGDAVELKVPHPQDTHGANFIDDSNHSGVSAKESTLIGLKTTSVSLYYHKITQTLTQKSTTKNE